MQPEDYRSDFPVLDRTVHDRDLVYLDNAATAQKPRHVIDAVRQFYEESNANVHRAAHTLSGEATAAFEEARETTAAFLGAETEELVFTQNATEALNLVAHSYGLDALGPDDEIVLTRMEHHSMILPWQHVAEQTGAALRYVDITEDGRLDVDHLAATLSGDTAVVGVTHLSNVLGVENDVRAVAEQAHDRGAVCIVDGAQSAPHIPVDVKSLGVDAFAFAGHKLCGPTGTGALYARGSLLDEMAPFHRGGGAISRVAEQSVDWADAPARFEAGTPNIAGVIGLAAAVDYLQDVGMTDIHAHSRGLGTAMYDELSALDGVTVYGPRERTGLVSFTVSGAHPHDTGTVLDESGIAVRGGHHCAQPLAEALGVPATTRASAYLYNTQEEVDELADAVEDVARMFGGGQ